MDQRTGEGADKAATPSWFTRIIPPVRWRVAELVSAVIFLYGLAIGATRRVPTPDNVSYLDIAHRWAQGDLSTAVNGYWSPVYSWILVPFDWFDVASTQSEPIIAGIVMIVAIDRLRHICRAVTPSARSSEIATEFALVGATPFLAFSALNLFLPDQLLATFTLGAICNILRPRESVIVSGLCLGVWTTLAALTKALGIPFVFVLLLVGSSMVRARRHEGQSVPRTRSDLDDGAVRNRGGLKQVTIGGTVALVALGM